MSSLPRAQWSSYSNYVLVTTGAIVGLGNIFGFPFLATSYGGIFVLFFVLCELFISIPLLFTELMIGRRGKQNPVGSISILAMESGASLNWRMVGWLCFVILFLTLAYYTVTVAFPLSYLINVLKVSFLNSNMSDVSLVTADPFTYHFFALELCFLFFLGATLLVIVRGINRGLEKISRITVPAYFVLLLALALYASLQGSFIDSVKYLFYFPENQPMLPVFFTALTFAFFKLNVGMGSMIVYGSYLPYDVTLGRSTAIILCLDALASLLSYFIICPLMLQSNAISDDVSLYYDNVIQIFSAVPNGLLIAGVFFFAAILAAWTPTIAMAEAAAITMIERFEITRLQAVAILGMGAVLIGTLVVLSNTVWPSVMLFNTWTIAGFIQNFASDIATPISAGLIAFFAGWFVSRQISFAELEFKPRLYSVWQLLVRIVAPICALVILYKIGFS